MRKGRPSPSMMPEMSAVSVCLTSNVPLMVGAPEAGLLEVTWNTPDRP